MAARSAPSKESGGASPRVLINLTSDLKLKKWAVAG
jgi:hypothetical protein